jgi:hypothetical protein
MDEDESVVDMSQEEDHMSGDGWVYFFSLSLSLKHFTYFLTINTTYDCSIQNIKKKN